MKAISLNTWGGRGGVSALLKFFETNKDVDIFCLQEIWNGGEEMAGKVAGSARLVGIDHHLLQDIQNALPEHKHFFRPHYSDYYGLALFAKKHLNLSNEGETFVYKEQGFIHPEESGNHGRNLQYASIHTATGDFLVAQVHGLWNGVGKGDSDDRILQSQKIAAFVKAAGVPVVLMGDFNLRPDTESVRILEEAGLRNLVTEFGVTSTRTNLYTKSSEAFADYIFVTDGIAVKDFKVLPDEVSDHSPLYIEFDIA